MREERIVLKYETDAALFGRYEFLRPCHLLAGKEDLASGDDEADGVPGPPFGPQKPLYRPIPPRRTVFTKPARRSLLHAYLVV